MFKFYKESYDEAFVEKVFEDGSYQMVLTNSPEVVDWIAAGNTLKNDLPDMPKEQDEARLQSLLGDNFISGHNPTGLYPADIPNN
jgi:hypothetical protein